MSVKPNGLYVKHVIKIKIEVSQLCERAVNINMHFDYFSVVTQLVSDMSVCSTLISSDKINKVIIILSTTSMA